MRELKQDWRDIFCGFRVALDIKKMFLGFLAVVLSMLLIVGWLWVAEQWGLVAEGSCSSTTSLIADSPPTQWGLLCQQIRTGLMALCWQTCVFTLVSLLILLVIWSLLGGAISRIAAVEFAKDERIDMREALSFAGSKFWSFFWSPIVPLIGIGIFMVCNDIGGWVGRFPWLGLGPLWVGIFFPLALLAGFLVTLLAMGAFFGLPLMFPTIAAEGTDAFDAISRAYSYVYSRPWRYIWYCLVSCVYGAVVCGFVVAFAVFMVEVTMGTVHFGMGDDGFRLTRVLAESSLCSLRDPMTHEQMTALGVMPITQQICAYAVLIWTGFLVLGPVLGFVASYVLTAESIVYSLMRKAVDGTDMTEVYVEEDEEDFSLPATEEAPAPAPEENAADAASDDTGADADADEEAAPAKKKAKKKRKKKATRKKKTT